MPTVQSLLNSVDTTYRNSYSIAQKVEWMDTTQKQIFQTVRHEALPYSISLSANFAYYPLPPDCDPMGIKQVVIETKAGRDRYDDLRFVSIESNEDVGDSARFYSIASNQNIFINPLPKLEDEGRMVFVYYNRRPAELTASQLDRIPDIEEDFQELLVLGCLERIARARGEYDDKNTFAADYLALLRDYKSLYRTPYPEYTKPQDKMPRRRGHVATKYGYGRRNAVYPWGE
ncbi:hypothetical protein [Paenibacillus polysaccharolyticus]|uniref:phage adaptor protein n=1 Tax=Paenibacillus polysaccharolyticus TaxID=582692 RepID=UPI0030095966